MPITYQYETGTKTVRARAFDLVSTKEILDYTARVIADPTVEQGFVEVVDFKEVKDLHVTYSDLDPFTSIWQRYLQKGCKAIVIYAPTDLSFGSFRMLQSFLSIRDTDAENLFIVVRSQEELESKLRHIHAS